jgi:hypothetical protein
MNVVSRDVELRDLREIGDLRKAGIEVRVRAELALLRQGVRQSKHSASGAQNQSAVLIDFTECRHSFF